jgi:hypothetical protein
MSTRTVSFQAGGDCLEAISVDLFAIRYRAVYLATPSENSRSI